MMQIVLRISGHIYLLSRFWIFSGPPLYTVCRCCTLQYDVKHPCMPIEISVFQIVSVIGVIAQKKGTCNETANIGRENCPGNPIFGTECGKMDKNVNRRRNRCEAIDMVISHALRKEELSVITVVEATLQDTQTIGKENAWGWRKMGETNFIRGDSRWSEDFLALHSIWRQFLQTLGAIGGCTCGAGSTGVVELTMNSTFLLSHPFSLILSQVRLNFQRARNNVL